MPFGFGCAAPRFASVPLSSYLDVDPHRGLSQYSTFRAPSQSSVVRRDSNLRRLREVVGDSGRPDSSEQPHAAAEPLVTTSSSRKRAPCGARPASRAARGTGSRERFQLGAGSAVGPGEHQPELVAAVPHRKRCGTASAPRRPATAMSVHSGSSAAATSVRNCGGASIDATPSRAPSRQGTRDMWRMSFAASNVDAARDDGPSSFIKCAESGCERTSFLNQRMSRMKLAMRCSSADQQLWRIRPCSYLRHADQVKTSHNRRVNAATGDGYEWRLPHLRH